MEVGLVRSEVAAKPQIVEERTGEIAKPIGDTTSMHRRCTKHRSFPILRSGPHSAIGGFFGPGSIRIDLGLSRSFQLRENHAIEFRAEAFNAPNHMNPGNPVVILTSGTFGKMQSAADPRIMRFALKYVF